MPKMKEIVLDRCDVLYNLNFLTSMPQITVFVMNDCYVDQDNMVLGIKSLIQLQHIEITNCSVIHAFNVVEAIKNKRLLRYIDVRGTGHMKSILACVTLNKCPAIRKFLFSNLYTYDSEYDRVRWFRIVKTRFPHVTFCQDLIDRVNHYCNTDPTVKLYFEFAEMLEKSGP